MLTPRHARELLMRTARLFIAAMLVLLACPASARDALPADFVYLRDIDPSIVQDMRYAGIDNFTGGRLPGYDAPECVLRRDVAAALKRVQAELAKSNLSLKTYDCYRPARTSRAMARWAQAGEDGRTKRFYPALDKRTLFSGYISAQSAHSTGIAIDLTIMRVPEPAVPLFDSRAAYGPCTAANRSTLKPRHGHRLRLLRPEKPHVERRDHA